MQHELEILQARVRNLEDDVWDLQTAGPKPTSVLVGKNAHGQSGTPANSKSKNRKEFQILRKIMGMDLRSEPKPSRAGADLLLGEGGGGGLVVSEPSRATGPPSSAVNHLSGEADVISGTSDLLSRGHYGNCPECSDAENTKQASSQSAALKNLK